jgi:hypothetical protein
MIVLTPLIALAAMQGLQTEQSLLTRIVGVPTGKNGYEDYLKAGDMAGSHLWPMYEQWIAYKMSTFGAANNDPDSDPTLPPLPPGVTPEMSDLAIRRAANDHVGGAFEVISIGNQKQVYDPRQDLSASTLFPEMAPFKMLAKIGANKAYVEFSEGRTTQAVNDLLEGIKFSKGIFGSILISSLVSIAIQSIMLAEFQRHLGQLSLSDVQHIDKACQQLIDTPYPIKEMLAREYSLTYNSIDDLLKDPSELLSEDENKAFGATIKGLGGVEQQQLKSMLTQALKSRYEDAASKLTGPESTWPVNDASTDAQTPLDDKSVSNLALVLANQLQGKNMQHQYIKAMAKARIQLRLLQLHAKVIAYHWQNAIWPAKLEDCADLKVATDPFSGALFHYEQKDGAYKLYSTGITGLGQIELKYRNIAAQENSGGDHPN